MATLKMLVLEDDLRREWQLKKDKDRKEVKQMKKEVEERWLQVHQRELRGIEKERDLSKERTRPKAAAATAKSKVRKSRNDGMNSKDNALAISKDRLSSGEPEANAAPQFGRDEGSVDELDSGLREPPLPADPFVQGNRDLDPGARNATSHEKPNPKGRPGGSKILTVSIDASGYRTGKSTDKEARRMAPSPKYKGNRGEQTGPTTTSRSPNNAQNFLSPAKTIKNTKASKNLSNTDLKKVHVASINIKAGLASNRRELNTVSPREPVDGPE